MNKQRAQVFIATTQGLVQVQSIVRLKEANIHSVVTVENTSQLAGISRDYHDFVAKPQGVISNLFTGSSFRLNLSKGIDQGQSWQLGVFIAHYLFENDCLSNHSMQVSRQTNDSGAKDIIIIATGRIDTLHYQVLAIDELSKKCLHANPHIAQWQFTKQNLCFLAPSINFRQPIPNSLMKLTPIANLSELPILLKLYGLVCQDLNLQDSINALAEVKPDIANELEEFSEGVTIEASLLERDDARPYKLDNIHANYSQKSPEDYDKHQPDAISRLNTIKNRLLGRAPLVIYIIIVTIFVWSLFSLTRSFISNNGLKLQNSKNPDIERTSSGFIVMGAISENRVNCLLARHIRLSEGDLAVNSHSNAINLNNLCDLTLITNQQINSLWLISDTKALIDLDSVIINSEEMNNNSVKLTKSLFMQSGQIKKWTVPLPTNRSQTRKFSLLAFAELPDEADLASLESYLHHLHKQGKLHDRADLQKWINNTQANNSVYLLEQELIIYQ